MISHLQFASSARERLMRLSRNAPSLLALLFSALIVLELGRAGLHSRRSAAALAAANSEAAGTIPPRVADPRRGFAGDAQRIASAHLFGVAVAEPEADESDAAATRAHLVLSGTIATQQPARGEAIIVADGPAKLYSVGDDIGGASLHAVYSDRVILDREGVLETLSMQRAPRSGHLSVVRAVSAPAAPPGVHLDSFGRVVDKEPGILDKFMRAVGSYDDKAGKLRGFLVYPNGNGAPLLALGLNPGDLVTAINGTALDDELRGKELLNSLQSSSRASVTVQRQGRTVDVTLDFADASSKLRTDPAPTRPDDSPGLAAGDSS